MNAATNAPVGGDRQTKRRRPRFLPDRKGSVAVEFVMLIIPFALLIFSIIETCIAFAGQQMLTNATETVARQVRTGQIRSISKDDLHDLVCARIQILVAKDCPELEVDLRSFNTFEQAAQLPFPISNGDVDASGFVSNPGPSLSKNMLRTFYRWPVFTDFLTRQIDSFKDGKRLIFATVIWQNEPFDDI
ncbi:MAG: pilus assembly protein [Rhizobiaceae bacterium]|nr:pilus assembly protein [Rhizobiaceae bacterium]MCV0405030.1 pilus assembly protein [Rhizobiaceae bacterium]